MLRGSHLALSALALTSSCQTFSPKAGEEPHSASSLTSRSEADRFSEESFPKPEESLPEITNRLAQLPNPIWTDPEAISRALEFSLADIRTLVLTSRLGTVSCTFVPNASGFQDVQALIFLDRQSDRAFSGRATLGSNQADDSYLKLEFNLGVLGMLEGELRLDKNLSKQNLSGWLRLDPSFIAKGLGVPDFDTIAFIPLNLEKGRAGQLWSSDTGFKWRVENIINFSPEWEFGCDAAAYAEALSELSKFGDGTIFLSSAQAMPAQLDPSPTAVNLIKEYINRMPQRADLSPTLYYRWQAAPLNELSQDENQRLIADIPLKVIGVNRDIVYLQSHFTPNLLTSILYGSPPWQCIDETLGLYAIARTELMHRKIAPRE